MIKRFYSHSYLFTVIVALVVGLFVSQATMLIAWNTLFLQIIFFLSCLKIDPEEVFENLKDWRFLVLANVLMLLVFPVAVWALGLSSPSEFWFALFLLAAMPVGMTTPLLVEVARGKQSLAMVLAVTTSLLAPLTIPFLVEVLYGTQISIDAFSMFKQLTVVIFIPFILAMITRTFFSRRISSVRFAIKPISIFLLGLLIAGAVSVQATQILSQSANLFTLVITMAALYLFFFVLHVVGYFSFWWESREVKQTASISLTYMNFSLAIFLASKFFAKPGIILPLVFSIIAWATFMPLWLKISKNFK